MEKNYPKKKIGPPEMVTKLARTFSVMGDSNRVRIIFALSQQEMCVENLASFLKMSPSAVSHQLRVLKDLDLVSYRKQGRRSMYRLQDEHIENIFEEGVKHVVEKIKG